MDAWAPLVNLDSSARPSRSAEASMEEPETLACMPILSLPQPCDLGHVALVLFSIAIYAIRISLLPRGEGLPVSKCVSGHTQNTSPGERRV